MNRLSKPGPRHAARPDSRPQSDPNPTNEWDDPVPSNSDWNWDFPVVSPHQIEGEVRSALLSLPEVQFTSLVVRRTDNGVCLQGVMQVNDEIPDVVNLVRQVAGVDSVLNQLLIQTVDAQVIS
jgi:hypothetical protein